MRWRLTPLDGSLDLVQITDETDTIIGVLGIDAFRDPQAINGGEVYQDLFAGHESTIDVAAIGESKE